LHVDCHFGCGYHRNNTVTTQQATMTHIPLTLTYAYDPLCGWCFGIIPALRHFAAHEPDVRIDVLPGGLFTGTPARSYSSLVEHIRTAELHLEQVTGRKPAEAFHAFIAQPKQIDAASERPCHAVLQMNTLAPDRAIDFAHRLQEVHYEDGADLNDPQTYDDLCRAMDLPMLDTGAIVAATLQDPMIRDAFGRCAQLGPQGFPTIFVMDDVGGLVGQIPSTYDPAAFLKTFRDLRQAAT
jgi:putative protein-disulfide isomerase